MPLALVPGNDYQFNQRREQARAASRVETVRGGAPWLGYVPDLPAEMVNLSGAQAVQNLMARADDAQQGEVLTQPPGFVVVDAGSYTVDATPDGYTLTGVHASSTKAVTMIGWFPRSLANGSRSGNQDLTLLMVTSGNASTAGSSQLWRLEPDGTANAAWEEIIESGDSIAMSADYPGAVTDVDSTRRQLCDWVAAPFGATPRTSPLGGEITEPSFLWTNDFDPVYIYPGSTTNSPAAPGEEDYEALTEGFGTVLSGSMFGCRSIELFNDRINFFNTSEVGIRYRQRLRRSSVGNCDPDPANDGTGYIDLEKFSGDGLRIERLGNMLACYLTDGMAVCRVTGSYIQPFSVETITLERGLIATHALCRIGGGRHFGIFNDGWFIVDNSGQFREVGVTDIGGGTAGFKWKYTFFDRIENTLVDRIHMKYDVTQEVVYITLPVGGAAGDRFNKEVWIYDILSDRVWPQVFDSTCFGTGQALVKAGETYEDWTGSYDDLGGSYGSYGPEFGPSAFMHGTPNAVVMKHVKTNPTRDSYVMQSGATVETATPSIRYQSVLSSGGNAREMKEAREMWLETVKSDATTANISAYSMEDNSSTTQTLNLTSGVTGKRIIQSAGLHKSGSQLSVEVTSPANKIKIVGIEVDIVSSGSIRLQGS